MKIYIDENFPPQLAEALNILEKPKREGVEVYSIKEVFNQGAKDEFWIPKVGKQKGIVITQDIRIQTTKHQYELYTQHGVGIFFFKAPKKGLSYWEMVKKIVNNWEDIKELSRTSQFPFAFLCKTGNKKFKPY